MANKTPEQIALERIDKAISARASKISLRNLGLTTLPKFSKHLTTSLTELDISENSLKEFLNEIFRLSNFTHLYIFGNQISSIPRDISLFSKITELYIGNNQLDSLPQELKMVLDTRLGQDENRVEYWLRMIQYFGGDSPVIVVGNKIDQQPLDIDRRGLQAKYPNIKAIVETSCLNGRGIEELKNIIAREVSTLPHVRDELPESWFQVKQKLEKLDKDFIPYSEYEALCNL